MSSHQKARTRALPLRILVVLVGVVAGLLMSMVGAAGAQAVGPVPVFGVQFHGLWSSYTDAGRAQVLDALKANGAQAVRIDVSWRMLEPDAQGVFSAWGLAQVDKSIQMAQARGLRPLVTLWMAPKWANGSDDERVAPTSAVGLAGLTDVSKRLAVRYAGVVDGWEVWNEPNLNDFMRGADPVVYAGVLKAAYAGFKAGSASTPVVFGGPSCVDDVWVGKVLAAGGAGKYDVMGVHPYQAVGDEAPEVPDNGTKYRMNHLPALIAVMAKYGEGAKPIWFTEFGWRAHVTLASDYNEARGVSPAVQADYLARTVALVRASYPTVARLYWYQDRADSQNPAEAGYGLVYPDGTVAPALKGLPAMLGTVTPTPVTQTPVTYTPNTSAASVFVPIAPTRVYDSRWSAVSGVTTGTLSVASTPAANARLVSVADGRSSATGAVASVNAIPTGATAVAYNLTISDTVGTGWLRVAPGGVVDGQSSTINWSRTGDVIANGTVTGVDAQRRITVTGGGGGSTHVIIDITGYYVPEAAQPSAAVFTAITPARAYDSRTSMGGAGALTNAWQSVDLDRKVTLPAAATAVAYNVTAVNTSSSGFLAVVPGNADPAGVSSVNWAQGGDVIANGLMVGVDANKAIKVLALGSADYIIDIVGYFTPASATPKGGRYYSVSPVRAYDSRLALPAPGALTTGSVRTVSVADGRDSGGAVAAGQSGVVPTGAAAVVFGATVANTEAAGFLSVNPGSTPDAQTTATSTMNWPGSDYVRANGSVVGIDTSRTVKLAVGGGASTDVIVDVVGYYK